MNDVGDEEVMNMDDVGDEEAMLVDEKFGERTILTRIHKIAEALNEQEARGFSIPEIAREILKQQQSRPTLTIDVAVYKSGDKGKRTGYIKQDGWVVIHPLPEDDDLAKKGDMSWHTDLSEAQETVRNAWGEVDDVLLEYVLQPAIVNVPIMGDGVSAENLATTLRKLQDLLNLVRSMTPCFQKNIQTKRPLKLPSKHIKKSNLTNSIRSLTPRG